MTVTLILLFGSILAADAYFGHPVCSGQKDVVVHLFEWKWTDVQKECPYLAELGYCAVQVSPPQEHAVLGSENPSHPWWQRYQPVSYKLHSRSGSEEEFIDMVHACNSVGVYIHVDAVIQHMTGGQSGVGSAGSRYNGHEEWYEGVPYSSFDFHKKQPSECNSWSGEIENYNDAHQVRFCRLSGLRDLRTGSDYVRHQLTGYLNKLIQIGVAGFRIDACKHVLPSDLEAIYSHLNNLPAEWFPDSARPFIYQEVIYAGGNEPIRPEHYSHLGRVTEFRFSASVGEVFRGWNGQRLRYLENFGQGWSFISGFDALVFVDNHDNQRGHGAGGHSILTHKDARLYKMATAFTLAFGYGMPRVMSSYGFDNTEAGPPSDHHGNTNDVTCFSNGWVCEHRWRQIYNMVKFHNVVLGSPVQHWSTISDNAIAFGRGGQGFIAINNEGYTVSGHFFTGMPDGEYCDVITCDSNQPPCQSCRSVYVEGGHAYISVPNDDDAVVAIHI